MVTAIQQWTLEDWCEAILTEDLRVSLPLVSRGRVWVTDGRILLEFTGPEWGNPSGPHWIQDGFNWQPAGDCCGGKPRISSESLELVLDPATGAVACPVPSVEGPPEGSGQIHWEVVSECSWCIGEGTAECDMGHRHTCANCKGEGKTTDWCEEASERVEILGRDFARRYVWMIGHLPGVGVVGVSPKGALSFVFRGGRGALMALAPKQ